MILNIEKHLFDGCKKYIYDLVHGYIENIYLLDAGNVSKI